MQNGWKGFELTCPPAGCQPEPASATNRRRRGDDARFFIARIIMISVRSLDKKIEILDKAG
jgi:hypothetical protein